MDKWWLEKARNKATLAEKNKTTIIAEKQKYTNQKSKTQWNKIHEEKQTTRTTTNYMCAHIESE